MTDSNTVTLIALTSMRGRKVVRARDKDKPGDRDVTEAYNISVGSRFEVSAEEAKDLVGSRAARRLTLDEQEHAKAGGKPVDDELEKKTVAELKEIVDQRGITLPAGTNTKAELITEIRKASAK